MANSQRMDQIVSEMERRLLDEGRLIAAGYAGLEMMIWKDLEKVPAEQRMEMRMAFFAGAQHLYATMMRVLDPGSDEPTDDDMRRMHNIHVELENFRQSLEAEAIKQQQTRGNA
jgi:hypothetical protein